MLLSVTHEDEIKSQLYTGHELLIQQGQKQSEKAVYSLDICAFLINSVLSFVIYTDLMIKEWLKILNACSKAFTFLFVNVVCLNTHEMNSFIFNIHVTKLVSSCVVHGKSCFFGTTGKNKVKENSSKCGDFHTKMHLLKHL